MMKSIKEFIQIFIFVFSCGVTFSQENILSSLQFGLNNEKDKGTNVEVQQSDSGIVIWGDSMGAGLTAERLSAGLKAVGDTSSKRNIVNWAIGGQSSWQVALRQGAIPWTAEVVGGEIPASGSVELIQQGTPLRTKIAEKTSGKIPADLHSHGGWLIAINNEKTTWVSIEGVKGQIVAEGEDQETRKFMFYRKEDGDMVKVKNPVYVKVLGTGKNCEHSLEEINRYIAILWPNGAHLGAFIPVSDVNGSAKTGLDPSIDVDSEMMIIHAMIEKISSPEKRFIILYRMGTFPAISSDRNMQKSRIFATLNDAAYRKKFSSNYFDFVPTFAKGMGEIQSAKDWLLTNYPEEFNNPETGWFSERHKIKSTRGIELVTPQEPAAVASLKLIENGGRGVKNSLSVATQTKGSTEFLKVGLKVGVESLNGIASKLTVREGGRGYTIGDRIIIPSGFIGNSKPIVGEVIGLRQETLGTVRNPDGSVDINSSYNQWDLDNGYIPRIFRRDVVHFTSRGADYLCLLLAAKIKDNGW